MPADEIRFQGKGNAASEDRLGALLNAAVDAMVLIDSEGRIARFNKAAEKVFGYAEAEVLGRNVSMLMPSPYQEEHDGYISRYRSTREPRIIGLGREVTARRKDGSEFPIDLSVGEFKSLKEQGFVGILRDISDRKAQELRLRQTAQELRLMFEQAPTPILLCDPHGHVLDGNRACLALLGFDRKTLSGMRQLDLVDPDDRDVLAEDFEALRVGEEARQREVRLKTGDGRALHCLLYTACARDDEGRPQMLITEIVDRTAIYEANREAEALRDRLAHAARLGTLGEMVSGIAHEVNQPLTAIANYASACRRMLLNQQLQPAELVSYLEKISAQAERAGQVIRGLRALTRRREAARESLEVNALVREISKLIEFELRGAGSRLTLDLAPSLPPVRGDGVQIQQVILNLVRNALEAMRDSQHDEEVRVKSAVTSDGWVEVIVTDRGPGLSPAVEARLFEPFVTTKSQGMGLGLSICSSIVSAHGGQLRHRRPAAGGAEFVVRIPASEES